MPHFLQTAFLTGLAALAVPILIHLFFRLKTKRVELGTIRFLRIVLEENARRRKVMRWLLLALRMGFVALLVGLFARPYFSSAATGGDKELMVILIDQSATMQLKGERGRLIDQAVDEAKKLIQSAGSGTRFEIAYFDHLVRPIAASKDLDAESGKSIVDRLKLPATLFGATNYGTAIAWARDIFVKASPGRKQLHLFTDLQRSGLDWTEVEAFPAEVKSQLHDLGNAVVNNIAVAEVRTPRLWVRPGEMPNIQASIQHGGAFPLSEVPIVLEIGKVEQQKPARGKVPAANPAPETTDFSKLTGRITKRERVKLEPGATLTLNFELPALDEGLWQGRVFVEYDDDLTFDNQRYFAISATPAYQVLVLNGGVHSSSVTSETYFVEMALRLASEGESFQESPFNPTVIPFTEEILIPNLSSYDAVVLANVGNMKPDEAKKLAAFVASGGGLLVFTGENVTANSSRSLTDAGLGVGNVGEPKVTVDLPWRLNKWNSTHPVLQPLSDPQHGDLRRMIFAAYTKITPASDTQVLVEFNTGDPAIIERRVGEGTNIWVAISCGRDWSDWSRSRLFLPLLHQLLGYEVGLTQGGRVRTLLVDTDLKGNRQLDYLPAANSTDPASEKSKKPTTVESSVPGVFQYERYVDVVNTSPRESDVERCSRQEFEDRFAMKFEDEQSSSQRAELAQGNVDFQRDEIWPAVACALLMVILLEGFVGNRTTA